MKFLFAKAKGAQVNPYTIVVGRADQVNRIPSFHYKDRRPVLAHVSSNVGPGLLAVPTWTALGDLLGTSHLDGEDQSVSHIHRSFLQHSLDLLENGVREK
jgi:hypothetical protein